MGATPLELAANGGHTEMVKLLLFNKKQTIELSVDFVKRCFYNTCSRKDWEIAKMILEKLGVDIHSQDLIVCIMMRLRYEDVNFVYFYEHSKMFCLGKHAKTETLHCWIYFSVLTTMLTKSMM